MKKRRIVLASVLKPVDDTRMYEKMGVSLARSGRYEVHIIGYPSNKQKDEAFVHFHSLLPFNRISFGRLAARLKVLKTTIKLKPELIIVTTPELLIVVSLIRIFYGTKIIYDIQENYWQNILYTNSFPKIIRPLIAATVRLKETIASPLFALLLLAEKCYADELGFLKKKYAVIENKCKVPDGFERKQGNDFVQLIFTGTLAESTGVFQAIALAKKLHSLEPKIRLHIIGFCARPEVLQKIENEISKSPFISLTGGKNLVAHHSIMDAIASANFGIVYYPPSPHTENKTPTKLYEYLACKLPILLQNNKLWVEMCSPYNAAIVTDFNQPDVKTILDQMRETNFYSTDPEGVTWQAEEKKFLEAIDSLK